MTWAGRFRTREYVRGSLWVLPLAGAALGGLLAEALADVEASGRWDYSASTATTFLSAIVGAMAGSPASSSRSAFSSCRWRPGRSRPATCGSGTATGMLKAVLAVLVGTFMFSYGLLRRVEERLRPEPRRHRRRALPRRRAPALPRLPRPLPPPAAAGRGRGARRGRGTAGARGSSRSAVAPDAGDRCRAVAPSASDADARRAQRAGRGDPGDRRRTASCAGRGARLRASSLPHAVGDFVSAGATLDPGARRATPDGARRASAARDGRARRRAHDRAGSGVRGPDHGRRRDQGAVAGRQRPDDCGAGDRPPRGDAQADRDDAGFAVAARVAATPGGAGVVMPTAAGRTSSRSA